MPYYNAGDYYGRGDYYQAGGLFSNIGHFLGGVAKAGLTFFTKGPVAAATEAIGSTVNAFRGTTPAETGSAPMLTPSQAVAAASAVPMIAPPGPGALTTFGGLPLGAMPGMPGMRRTHPNRSTYVTRGGGTSKWPQQMQLHPKGSTMVTSRRMNVGNARALRRALRRARGFAKLARKVLVATSHYKGGGHRRRKK